MTKEGTGITAGLPRHSDLRGRLLEAADSVRDTLSEVAMQYGVHEADILRSIVRAQRNAPGDSLDFPSEASGNGGRAIDRQRRRMEEENHILRNAIEFLWDVNRKAGRTPKSSTRWSAN